MREQIEDLKATVEIEGVELPDPPEILHGETPEENGNPLISSEWDWAEQTRALIAHKAYESGGVISMPANSSVGAFGLPGPPPDFGVGPDGPIT